ncbi:RING [Musa troglodytarum]|uniref:RING n=1 Tax=Musa troglodytarum TaxID=320322 RepID=A0A9E7KRY3_9LILI|nr:RING [Musa troglodytarum]
MTRSHPAAGAAATSRARRGKAPPRAVSTATERGCLTSSSRCATRMGTPATAPGGGR